MFVPLSLSPVLEARKVGSSTMDNKLTSFISKGLRKNRLMAFRLFFPLKIDMGMNIYIYNYIYK